MGRTLSWSDLASFLEHLSTNSAFWRTVDPWAKYLRPDIDTEIAMAQVDAVDALRFQIATAGVPKEERPPAPPKMRERIRIAKLAEEAKDDKPKKVVDIRGELARRRAGIRPDRTPKQPNPNAVATRERLRAARAAVQQ